MLPETGVYAVHVYVGPTRHSGVINIGHNPTFDRKRLSVETHILDFHGNLYGQEIRVEFLSRIRNELRFESPEALISQIQKDIKTAKTLFTELPAS